jgi:hypothetical protein
VTRATQPINQGDPNDRLGAALVRHTFGGRVIYLRFEILGRDAQQITK